MQEEWPLKYSATCLIFQKVEVRSLLMVRTNVARFTTVKHFCFYLRTKDKIKPRNVNIQESI